MYYKFFVFFFQTKNFKQMKQVIIFLLMIISIVQLNAQKKEYYKDIVYLKNESKIYGQLLDYKIGEKVEIKLSNGQILTFPDNVVQKIVIYSPEIKEKKERFLNYEFKDKVFYNNFGFKMIGGASSTGYRNIYRNGFGLEYNLGYRYNHYLSVGLGAAIENYNYGLEELFYPVYFDFMSFYSKSKISPFFRFQIGYGFVTTKKNINIDNDGGIMINPAFGIKYPASDKLNYMFDINFKYQKAYFVYRFNERSSQIAYRDVIFRRIAFRFSIMF